MSAAAALPHREDSAPNRFYKHPLLTGITIAVVLVLALDLIVGTLVHRRAQRLLRIGLANERSYRVRDSVYHHGLKPMMRVDSALWGNAFYPVRTNSLGFKDRVVRTVDASSDRPRVLIIGDSFAEGLGVEYDSTVAGRIATRAQPAGIEIVNAAVASYSPIIYYRKTKDLLERQHLRVDEVVVFIDISDIMDETYLDFDSMGTVQGNAAGGLERRLHPQEEATSGLPLGVRVKNFLRTHSFGVYRALNVAAHPSTVFTPAYESPSCDPPITEEFMRCRGGWTSNPALMSRYGRLGLSRAQVHMSQLAALLKQHGIPLTVVVYPWPYQLQWNDRHSLQSTTWRDWAGEQQVTFVDLFPAFFAQVDSSSLGAVTKRYFLEGDVHWNARGNAFVAEKVVESYCREQRDSSPLARPPLATAICVAARQRGG